MILTTKTLLPGMSIGYYGGHDSRGRERVTQVHVHKAGVGPVCGSRLAQYMRFHWCSNRAESYVECGHCKKALNN